jgi:hypothetical protein
LDAKMVGARRSRGWARILARLGADDRAVVKGFASE